jgi:AcrR family transcriptional regulator
MSQDHTKAALLAAALKVARRYGLYNMRRADVAAAAQVPHRGTVRKRVAPSLVSHYFESMGGLRKAMIAHILATHTYIDVLAQALAERDPDASKAPAGLKREALDTLA